MEFLRKIIHKQKPHFEKGGKWEKFYYIFEAHETLAFVPDSVTAPKGTQIKDAVDMKRMMMTVIISMIPCLLFGIWNTGHMHFSATGEEADFIQKILLGAQLVVPIIAVSYMVGLGIEFTFATIRRHPINEGYLVTGMLIPLIMPASIPLWQVALATAFAVIIGKEAFGGTGMNILNVALTARAFLYFAYPSDISGDVWTYLGDDKAIEAYSGATALSVGATAVASDATSMVANLQAASWMDGMFSWFNMFIGIIPGCIGETSTLLCLVGAVILIVTRVASWKIIVGTFGGAYIMGLFFNAIGGNAFLEVPAHYHLVMGGLAFGAVFMATDPVSAAQTETGKWIYGLLIGALTVLIRVLNPAYPEGIMLAILFMNVFAPLVDFYVVEANKKRRLSRATV